MYTLDHLKNKYRIIVVREGEENIRQFSIGNLVISSFVLLFLFAIASIALLFTDNYSHQQYAEKLNQLQSDNSRLVEKIHNQSEKIDHFVGRMDTIISQDKHIRDLIRMPQIHDDIRKVGVGGNTGGKEESDLNYLLPEGVESIDFDKFNKKLDFYNRLANLEFMSYREITKTIANDLNRYRSFPAIHPVNFSEAKLKSGYGMRRDPFIYKDKFHPGHDFSARRGTHVFATADGVVRESKVYGTFGNYIEIDHGYGYITIYGHLDKRKVKKGEKIVRGQYIGTVGSTGRSTASHLHYEVHHQNEDANPGDFYFDDYVN